MSTEKEVTTLGRGGSDTTAVALAAALDAERCEILTDVDAVYTADPRIVGDARRIEEISYEDMAELARFGATVLKEEAVRFAERAGIAISVGASSGTTPGTIVLNESNVPGSPIVGMGLLRDAGVLNVRGGSLLEAREKIAGLGRSVRYVAAATGGIQVAVDLAGAAPGMRALLSPAIPAGLVCAVGPEAASGEAVAGAAAAVAGAELEVLGASGCGRTMTFAVRPEAGEAALKALHSRFFPSGTGTTDEKTSSPLR